VNIEVKFGTLDENSPMSGHVTVSTGRTHFGIREVVITPYDEYGERASRPQILIGPDEAAQPAEQLLVVGFQETDSTQS